MDPFLVTIIGGLVVAVMVGAIRVAWQRWPARARDIRGDWRVTGRPEGDGEEMQEHARIKHQFGRHFWGTLSGTDIHGRVQEFKLRGEFYDDYKITYRHYLPAPNRARDVGVGILVVDNGLTKGKGRSLNVGTGPDGDFTEPRVFDVDVERF